MDVMIGRLVRMTNIVKPAGADSRREIALHPAFLPAALPVIFGLYYWAALTVATFFASHIGHVPGLPLLSGYFGQAYSAGSILVLQYIARKKQRTVLTYATAITGALLGTLVAITGC